MATTTLYRKYRPQKFSEIIGQVHIVQTLSNAVKNNRIGQAYIFTGPRGTGKTTLARVFAKAVNCADLSGSEPCRKCAICKNIEAGKSLDIIEIDAASNTGVDNIRELRETVKLPPTQAKFKVYIIDEVHMLSTGAFNALLKTLEEPPSHVIFILATTEIHKVPETILSRCQRFDFARLTLEQIIRKLSAIAKNEGVKIEKNALEMIAVSSEGAMRDAESLLAQIISLEDKNITAKEVEEILGAARLESVEGMAEFILKKDTAQAMALVNKLSEEGTSFEVFHKSLLNYLRQLMIVSVSPDLAGLFSLELTNEQIKKLENKSGSYPLGQILNIIENLIDARQKIRSSFIPQLPLEIAIVKSTQNSTTQNLETKTYSPKSETKKPQAETQSLKIKTDEITKIEIHNDKNEPGDASDNKKTGDLSIGNVKDNWSKFLVAVKPHNHSLIAYLSNCQPVKIEDGKIIIATRYNLYKEKLNEKTSRSTIEDVFGKILNSRIFVKFVTEEEAGVIITKQPTTDNEQQNKSENGSLLDDAISIMGGKIVK